MHESFRWRAAEGTGAEHLTLREDVSGIRATGVLIGGADGEGFGAHYELRLDPQWMVRRLQVHRTDGAGVELVHDGAGGWSDTAGAALPDLEGCLDLDLSGSAFTNSLPINRIAWCDERPERFDMVYIPMETMVPRRDGQIYTRLRPGRFRYQSADRDFEALLSTDEAGLLTDYPGLFERA